MSSVPVLPPRFPDPPDPPKPIQTLSRWDGFIGSIASGVSVQDAMLKHYVKRADIETVTRKDKAQLKRYRDAKLAGLRAEYSEFDLDELFDRIAMGKRVHDAYQEVFGKPAPNTFFKLMREDADIEERYTGAMRTKATLEMEKAIAIIDDDSKDTLPGPKGGEIPNMAAVNRSRLMFEGRHKLSASWYRRLYGEQKEQVAVQVNLNLAERMERGIQRLRGGPQEGSEAIDAVFTTPVEVKAVNTSWMDEQPTDPMWREEK